MERRPNSKEVLLGERRLILQHYLLVIFLALLSMSAFAQSPSDQVPRVGCKPGNLYEESDRSKRDKVEHFLEELRIAVKDGDKLRVAQLAHYPLRVATAKAEFTIDSQKAFVNQYNEIMPVELRTFLLKQQPQCISRVGVKGFSIGNGQIWFDEYPDGGVKMFAVNAIVYPGE